MAHYLTEGLLSQMNRVNDLIEEYNKQSNSVAFIEVNSMKTDIQNAEEAISAHDVENMLISFKKLKDYGNN